MKVISNLRSQGVGPVSASPPPLDDPTFFEDQGFFDVDGNHLREPLDAVQIISFLRNGGVLTVGEGEGFIGATSEIAASASPQQPAALNQVETFYIQLPVYLSANESDARGLAFQPRVERDTVPASAGSAAARIAHVNEPEPVDYFYRNLGKGLSAERAETDSFSTHVSNIRNGGGLNGARVLDEQTADRSRKPQGPLREP